MKTLAVMKAALVAASFGGMFWAVQATSHDAVVAECKNVLLLNDAGQSQLVMNCVDVPTTSWLSWFQGESRSTQFHFIDLLELLNRMNAPVSGE